MKKIIIGLVVLLTFSRSFAQEGEDVGWVARFGAAGGIAPAFVFPNVDPVNMQLRTMGIPELSNSMFVYGGGGYAYIMIVDNLRLGGIGFSGSQSSAGKLSPQYFQSNFEVKQNYSFGGLTVEYTLPFVNKVALSVGAVIGLGTQSFDIYNNYSAFDWSNVWGESVIKSTALPPGTHSEIKNNFISITPTLNLDVPLNRFIAVRVGGGYVLPLHESWSVNNDQNIKSIPSDLKANSFFIQTGIYFGFFAF